MSRFTKTTIILLAVMLVGVSTRAQEYYYGTYDRMVVLRDSTKMLMKFDPAVPSLNQSAFIESVGRIADTVSSAEAVDGFVACSLQTGAGYSAFLDSLQAAAEILLTEPFYVTEQGGALYIGQSFCAAFEGSVSSSQIDSINDLYSVSIQRELRGMPNVYLLHNSPGSGLRTLDLANLYHSLPETEYACPAFGMRPQLTAYKVFDYYSDHQPHTKKVIGQFNGASVWDFAGLTNTVTVAVVDDGTDSHEDLPSHRILPGYDFAEDDSDAAPGPAKAHGMSCAGIIAASHTTDSIAGLQNSSGIASLNPHVNVLPVKIGYDTLGLATYVEIAEAITWAHSNGADILSNSWGWPDKYAEFPTLTRALERAALFGRDGRGCPVIQSSGNITAFHSNPNYVRYPAWLPNSFAVGAIRLDDIRWDYSCYGPGMDIVAPSDDGYTVGVWSLDQMGSAGYNPGWVSDCPPGSNDDGYHCWFGGTSAAAPVVAGVAALLLSKDSALSTEAVYYILENSAVRDLDWGSIPEYHLEYGYGRVDAFRAVLSI
ncbi:S8 family serine peptidase [candidate division GN15 bacterium]|nr:S8 family serine peptidase [candidate division GN15 bacterium]